MVRQSVSVALRACGAVLALVAALFGMVASGSAATAATGNTSVAIGRPAPFGDAPALGSMAGQNLKKPIVTIISDPVHVGYWLIASDGGVFGYGAARFHGSAGAIHLNKPIVGGAAAPDGQGYWLVASDGGIFTYGSARFHGSTGSIRLHSPIVGMAATPDGKGYWLVAADGGIFAFGTAHFYGSTGKTHLDTAVIGMAVTPDGKGYWIATAGGGVFPFGTARYHGGANAYSKTSPIAGIAASQHGGYWLTAANGTVLAFDAESHGSLSSAALSAAKARITGIVMASTGLGYWLLPGALPPPPPPPPVYLTEPTVQFGATGTAVALLQKKLSALGYWVNTADGVFEDSTQQAVWALQKAAGLTTDGVVGPSTWKALFSGVLPHARSTSGYVIEVNLKPDLVMFVLNGKIQHILNTSTGGGYTYVENGQTNVATTPTGVYNIYAASDGLVTDSLGQLWRPRYFFEGFAIHGDGYVPPVPVSHGCVRVSNEAINWIWANNIAPIGTEVWVYS